MAKLCLAPAIAAWLVGWLVWSASFSTGDVLPPLLLLLLWRGAVVVARGK